MSLIIIGKMGIAGVGIAFASVGGIALNSWLNPKIEIYGLVSPTQSLDLKDKSLKCQIGSSGNKFWCTVEEVIKLTDETVNSTKPVLLSKFVDHKKTESIKSQLTEKKLYKITANASNLANKTWHAQEIEIFDVSASTEGISAGKINPIFNIKETKEVAGKTKQFVGQADKASTAGETLSDYKCSWSTTLTDLKSCSIYPFASESNPAESGANMSSLTFTNNAKPSTSTQEIKPNHYYLIEFTNHEDTTKDLESLVLGDLIYAKDSTQQITFANLSAVAVVGDQLLILKQQQTAS